ncbi:MAG: 2-hydroxyacyl-CoA dehydratase family protein [Spirochaetota bacterium]|nr:2-hydroxyacyl-CoA dehydratase family protein [Spirochaetota bacterium]
METSFQNMITNLEQRLKERPRGFDYFAKEMFSTFLSAFDKDRRVVYVSAYAFPMELLWAFDVVPFDFEMACNNLPIVMQGEGSSIMVKSENVGYSRNICSFDRVIIGCMYQDMLPKGDLYITSSYYCHGKAKRNEVVAKHHGKGSILFDVPNEISPSSIKYVTSQLKEIASMLENITSKKLDMDRLKEAIRWSNRARSSSQDVNELMKTKPCPWDGYLACMVGLGGSIFQGSPIRDEINQMLIREMRDRIDNGKLFSESHRVLWFPWVPAQTTNIFTTLKENHVSVPTAEATMVWWSEIDESNPFEALAFKSLQNPHVGRAERRVENIIRLAEEYIVDGAIHFTTPACYHENGSLRLISDALKNKSVPLLNLDGDMSDERNYFPEQTLNKLSTFIEMLKSHSD